MIAAGHHIMMGGKKIPTAKDYVQSGLVVMWDTDWNAGDGIHDENTGQLADLSGNNLNAQIPSGFSWSNKSLVANTTAGIGVARPSWVFDDIVDSGGYTLEFVACLASGATGYLAAAANKNSVAVYSNALAYVEANSIYGGEGTAVSRKYFTNNLAGVIASVALVVSLSNTTIVYVNGVSVGSTSGGGASGNQYAATHPQYSSLCLNTGYLGASIGVGNGTQYYRYAAYSRALTAQEIAANYAIDKARFGLI